MLSSPAAVAKKLGISPRAVYKAIHAQRFVAVRVFGATGPVRIYTDPFGRPLAAAPGPGRLEWRSLSDAARVLRVSTRVLAAACRAERIEAIRLPSGLHWRVRVDLGTGLPVLLHK